ncbi:MAG: zinc ABC transporter substrate-binding protein [candidate division KSB1 bacterium]|jgi:manganese/zinc/iron transport system substrate-binding protein|nr:zinc ABC transporter substrate-binding protein [candidate division KSB1 bacterium]
MRQFIYLFILLLLSSCAQSDKPAKNLSGRTISVVATTGMITDAVKIIGGDRVEVQGLMGPGVDPHLYKASEGDVRRMAGADIIFYNGLHLEGKMTDVFGQMSKRIRTTAVAEGLPDSLYLAPPEFAGAHDPHLWFDVALWMRVAERIRDTFIEMDPDSSHIYESNATIYMQTLRELDDYVKQRCAELPPERRILITAHDAFNYFGRAYGFEVRGLQGISTAAETGTADVKQLSDFILDRQVKAIFVETSVSPRYIEALQAAVRARGFDVKIGGNLYSDALGSADSKAGTYIGMVRHNIDTIIGSLK